MAEEVKTQLLLEPADTLTEKMNWLTRPPMPAEFDFYGKNWLKLDEKWNVLILETRIRSDIIKKISIYEQVFFPKWIQAIKDYTLCTMDRWLRLKEKGMQYLTNEKQPIIRTYVDRLVQTLFKANFTIKAYPVSSKNAKKAKIVEHFAERCFSSSKAKKTLVDMWTEAITVWPAFARSGFLASKEKAKEIADPVIQKVWGIQDNYAQFEWVSEFNLFGEPFVPFYEQRELVFRNVLPLKVIMKKLAALDWNLKKEHLQVIIRNPKPFIYKNYDKIRLIKYYEDYALGLVDFRMDNLFQLTLDNNHCEYVERWTEDNLVLCINGYIVYDWPNPLKKTTKRTHPFKNIKFTRSPWVWVSDWVGTLLAWQQKLYDALYNLTFDLIKFNAGPMFLLQPGQAIEGNDKILDYEPFSFKQIRWPGKIETLELPKPDPTTIKAMSDILQMADFAISPSSYNQIQTVSRSATDSNLRYEWLKDSVLALMESMNEMLSNVVEDWIKEAKVNMPREFEIPVFWDDGSIKEWATIKLKDLEGKYIYEFESESLKDINKIVERSQFTELVNAVKVLGQDPLSQRWMVNNEELLRNTFDLFNQNPDMVMDEKTYYEKIKSVKKSQADLQMELQKYFQSIQPQPQFNNPPTGFQQNNPGGMDTQSSESSSQVWEPRTELWWVPIEEGKQPINIASILKAAQE